MRLLRMLAIAASIALHVDGSTGHAGTAAPTCSSRQQTATEHEKIAYFRIAEQRRAARYLESAKSWLKEFRRVGRDEDMQNGFADEDSFVYGWLASQQLFAALTVGKNSTAIMAKAANIAHAIGDAGVDEITTHVVAQCILAACMRGREFNQSGLAKQLIRPILRRRKKGELPPQLDRQISGILKAWSKCGMEELDKILDQAGRVHSPGNSVDFTRSILLRDLDSTRTVLTNPADAGCSAANELSQPGYTQDVSKASAAAAPLLQLKQHELWPVHVATAKVQLPPDYHAELSRIVTKRYKHFSENVMSEEPDVSKEQVNNGFFDEQLKADLELRTHGNEAWPELYNSEQYVALRTTLHHMAVEQAHRISGLPKDVLARARFSMWAAVYTAETPHLTHVHESSLLSGSYYASAPVGSSPIVFTDPRGGQPMHIDTIQPELEPEAPFIGTYTFFPNVGDVVMFPSWLPHRVPPHPKGVPERCVFAFNLELGGDLAWLSTT